MYANDYHSLPAIKQIELKIDHAMLRDVVWTETTLTLKSVYFKKTVAQSSFLSKVTSL